MHILFSFPSFNNPRDVCELKIKKEEAHVYMF